MDTRSNLSWTIVGFDAVNTCFPDIMDLLNVPLDVKILKDLQQIEENLPRVVVQSPEMLRVVSAWTNLCRKARDGKLVYSVVMVHAWLNHAPLGKYKDLYETYLFVAEPKTFDWGWHLHNFILGVRQVFRKCGVLSSAVDVSRLSAVEVPPDSLQDSNWHLINMLYDVENFKQAKFGKGIIPFCHNDTVMANYRLERFTTKCFPEGGFIASLPGENESVSWYVEGRGKFFMLFTARKVYKVPGDFVAGEFLPGGHICM
jgi:hypothetical protein